MVTNYQDFTNQFILCKNQAHIPASWQKRQLGEWFLGYHPSLPVIEIQSHTEARLGWMLGYPIDENRELLSQSVVYEQKVESSTPSQFEMWLYRLGGTFIAIFITPQVSRFYLDAGGALPAVYHPESQTVASATTLIDAAEPDESLVKAMGIPKLSNWYPFGLTSKKSVERLVINHYLDLVSWTSHRHWPTGETETNANDYEAIVQEIAQTIRHNIEGVAKKYPLYLALTAGKDTRLLLACSKDFLDKIIFYTFRYPDAWGELDSTIAAEIAGRFNLNYQVYEPRYATERQQEAWLERTGRCVWGRVLTYHTSNYQLDPGRPSLIGKPGGTGQTYFYNKLGAGLNTKLTAKEILNLLHFPQTSQLVDRANQWLQSLAEYDAFVILDLLLFEQRQGCWGGPQQYGNNWNIFQTFPLCHRKIYDLLWQVPRQYRIEAKLGTDLIESQWPELLEFPINNYRGFRGLKNNIKQYRVLRGLTKMIKSLKK